MTRHRKAKAAKPKPSNKQSVTLEDLPPRNCTRWNNRRKQIVVAAVESGLISLWEASDRYRLSIEEYFTWKRASSWNTATTRQTTHAKSHGMLHFKQAA